MRVRAQIERGAPRPAVHISAVILVRVVRVAESFFIRSR